MAERTGEKRRFISKAAETVAGGIVTLGLLLGPIIGIALMSQKEQERYRTISQSSRYVVQLTATDENPILGHRKIKSTIYTDHKPIVQGDADHTRYILENVLYYNPHTAFFRSLPIYPAIDPTEFSIQDRGLPNQ